MNDAIARAEAEVEARREALMETVRELQTRLEPRTLMREAWETAKVKGADLAEEAVDAVRARPYAAGGVLAAIALFLAREPIADIAGNLVEKAKRPRKGKAAKKTAVNAPAVKAAGPRKARSAATSSARSLPRVKPGSASTRPAPNT